MNNRNTLQRRMVLEALQTLACHPTADEIYQYIAERNELVSRATVYRNLKLLSEQGVIQHIPIPDGADCFDHNITPHYHFRCRKCFRVTDIEMPFQEHLEEKITDRHNCLIESHHLLFTGLCPACQ